MFSGSHFGNHLILLYLVGLCVEQTESFYTYEFSGSFYLYSSLLTLGECYYSFHPLFFTDLEHLSSLTKHLQVLTKKEKVVMVDFPMGQKFYSSYLHFWV